MSTKKRLFPRVDAAQASVLVGIALAMAIVVLVNVLSTRHFTRWDWTANKRYSLTPATVQTLHDLSGPVQVWVLLGPADPLEQSVKQLLVAYQAETGKLDVHYIDPDRDVVALEDVKKRFKIETGRTDQGHVVADAIVVVANGDKHWFLSTSDMVEVSSDDTHVKPKEERALTGAIRSVLGSEKTKLCFTSGHGEMPADDVGREGAGMLRDVLEKDNYEVATVDPGAPNAAQPFASCGVVVIAGMRGAFTKDEAERLRTWLLGGGNLLVAASPITGASENGMVPPNLDRVLAPFGIALDEDLVIEEDAELSFPGTGGIRFVAEPRPHALTAALARGDDKRDTPRTVIYFARSMHKSSGEPGGATPADLLVSSAKAFGITNISGASEWKDAPQKKAGDLGGPLVLAMAAERPKTSPSAAHGPRVVVLGSASPLTSPTFREPLPLRGAALLVESAISWLAAKPQMLDVPEKASVPAGIRITDDERLAVRRYVVFMMPGTALVLGLFVGFWRRRTEGAPRKEDEPEAARKKKRRARGEDA